MIVEHGERRIHVEVEGDPGRQPAVFALHGGPGFTHDYFRPGLDRLAAQGYAVIYLDLPGGGLSSRHAGTGFDLAPYLGDLDAVRAAVGGGRTALLGHAWGGILAVEYALTRRVDALILVNPLRILRPEGQDNEAQARRVEAVDPSLFSDFLNRLHPNIEAALAGDTSRWTKLNADPWWARVLDTQLAGAPSDEWRAAMCATAWGIDTYFDVKGATFSDPAHRMNGYDLAERAAALRIPTLIFASDNDANYVAPARIHASLVAEAIPGAKVVRMDDYGHFPFAEAPDPFAAATAGFLRRHIPPTAPIIQFAG